MWGWRIRCYPRTTLIRKRVLKLGTGLIGGPMMLLDTRLRVVLTRDGSGRRKCEETKKDVVSRVVLRAEAMRQMIIADLTTTQGPKPHFRGVA